MKTHTETGAGLTGPKEEELRRKARETPEGRLLVRYGFEPWDTESVARIVARKAAGEIAELRAALVGILADVPLAECNDFLHSKQDRHHGLDCPAQKRWEAAIEKARAALNSRP